MEDNTVLWITFSPLVLVLLISLIYLMLFGVQLTCSIFCTEVFKDKFESFMDRSFKLVVGFAIISGVYSIASLAICSLITYLKSN